MELQIFCDGGARNNPGPAAIGFTAKVQGLKLKDQKRPRIGRYIGIATNNQAEYQAVIHALEWVIQNLKNSDERLERINMFLDSSLVVNQLNGRFKIKNPILQELLFKVRCLENQIEIPITYKHIPREENKEADRLVNETLDRKLIVT